MSAEVLHPSSNPSSRPRDVQTATIGTDTTVLRSRTWDRLKFEVEYAQQRGTTANSYLIRAEQIALIVRRGNRLRLPT
jgi:flavorubredoxin